MAVGDPWEFADPRSGIVNVLADLALALAV